MIAYAGSRTIAGRAKVFVNSAMDDANLRARPLSAWDREGADS